MWRLGLHFCLLVIAAAWTPSVAPRRSGVRLSAASPLGEDADIEAARASLSRALKLDAQDVQDHGPPLTLEDAVAGAVRAARAALQDGEKWLEIDLADKEFAPEADGGFAGRYAAFLLSDLLGSVNSDLLPTHAFILLPDNMLKSEDLRDSLETVQLPTKGPFLEGVSPIGSAQSALVKVAQKVQEDPDPHPRLAILTLVPPTDEFVQEVVRLASREYAGSFVISMGLRSTYLDMKSNPTADAMRQIFSEPQLGPCTVVDFQAFKLMQQEEKGSETKGGKEDSEDLDEIGMVIYKEYPRPYRVFAVPKNGTIEEVFSSDTRPEFYASAVRVLQQVNK